MEDQKRTAFNHFNNMNTSFAVTIPQPRSLSFDDVYNILDTVAFYMLAVFLVVAVIYIIIAAFKYLTSGGNPEKVQEATTSLIYSAIAIAVALLAWGFVNLVADLLGG